MPEIGYREIGRFLLRTAAGCLLAALLTELCFRLQFSFATTAFLYLIVVVLQSLSGSFASSALVSLVTVACLDYFFVPPVFSLQVTNPLDGVALVSFLITGLVITRLTTQVRKQATISDSRRRQMNKLYEVASQLLALDPGNALLASTVELFQQAFHLDAVCLYDSLHGALYCAGNSTELLAVKTQAAFHAGQDSESNAGVVLRCLRAAGDTIGSIGFGGLEEPDLNGGPLSALAAAMLERYRAFQNASHAAAATRVEVFRGAVLDALAHEFKTPLATILTAAGCLREMGTKDATHEELAELIESETSRLTALTSRILKTGQLKGDEIEPRLELTNLVDLVSELVDQCSRRCADRHFRVSVQQSTTEVLVDRDLMQVVVGQLLENACKYSPPGSPVEVSIETENGHAAMRVRNKGKAIEEKERRRLFERFYRGAESSKSAPGSGLGLYFTKKIVCAHGGSVELEEQRPTGKQETVFRVALPLAGTA